MLHINISNKSINTQEDTLKLSKMYTNVLHIYLCIYRYRLYSQFSYLIQPIFMSSIDESLICDTAMYNDDDKTALLYLFSYL